MGGNVELARGERAGGVRERGVTWMGGLDLAGDLGADRPGLGVGLVEEHAGGLRGRGQAGEIDGGGHRF